MGTNKINCANIMLGYVTFTPHILVRLIFLGSLYGCLFLVQKYIKCLIFIMRHTGKFMLF